MKFLVNAHFLLFSVGLVLGLVVCGCTGRLPSSVKVERNIPFARVNGRTLKLDIYSPQQMQANLPVVIWLHPGAWDMGSKNFCPIGFMAAKGLAIVSVDYRLSTVAPF